MKFFKYRISLFFSACIIAITCSGQQAVIRTHTLKDGLVMNRVRGFFQDADGFIWIYTWDGLSRLEGDRFRNYVTGNDLNHGLINDMVEFPEGRLFIALNNGTVEVIKDLNVQPGLRISGPTINVFLKDSHGRVLAGTDYDGLCLFNGDSCEALSPARPEVAVFDAVVENDLFFMVMPNRLRIYRIRYDQSGESIIDIRLLKEWNNENEYFECILKDKKNRILVGTAEGLKQIQHLNAEEFLLGDPDFLKPDFHWKNWRVHDIVQSENGAFWLATPNGLVTLNSSNDWSLLTTKDGLPFDNVTSLFIDRSQILWIGTDLGAASINLTTSISRFNIPACQYINFLFPTPDNFLYCICDSRTVLLLDSSGVVRGKRNAQNAIGLIHKSDKLNVVMRSGIDPIAYPLPSTKSVMQLPVSTMSFAETQSNIYFLGEAGLECCTSEGNCRGLVGLPDRIATLSHYGNKLLLGTWGKGIFIAEPIDSQNCQLEIVEDLTKWLPGKEIRSIMVSTDGAIWAGTRYHGLIRLTCNSNLTECNTEVFNITNGLISNWINSLAEDRDGNIWVGSISGIDKIISSPNGYRVFSYSNVFGLYGIVHHIAVTSDNAVWVAFSTELTRLGDGHIDTLSASQVYITDAVLGGNEQMPKAVYGISLPFNKNSANFSFAAPDYISQSHLQFSYRLLGGPDTSWSQPDPNQQIFYGNLFPGSYRFEVAAYGWNGKRGKPAFLEFKIRPPFWRQFWFVTLMVFCTAAILYSLYRFRIAQINRLQVVRDRIASDLHDDIGSSLSHVNILSELGKQELHKSEKTLDILERIGSEAQYSSEALDDIIWSVKSKSDIIGNVVARMRQYATELFDSAGIRFQIKEDILTDQPLNMEFRRDFYLAYKEILRNIVRHAHATRVEIEILIRQDLVRLSIRDNGKGFDVNKPTERSGILNIKERAGRWKGDAKWDSMPGRGSHVTVVMKQK